MRMFSRKVTLPSRVLLGYSTIPWPYPRITSHVYNIYETIPPLDTTWYTIWAKVIVIVATYRRVVTPAQICVRPRTSKSP